MGLELAVENLNPLHVTKGIDSHASMDRHPVRPRRSSPAGCEEPRNPRSLHDKNPAQAPAPAPPAEENSIILGKRTQDIREAKAEKTKGAVEVGTKITAKDYLSLQGNAYVTTIGKTSILSIQHAMDLYKATNDRYPKDYDEFMAEIIKANNIALPKLPTYQEYGYDKAQHKLIILEYADRK